MSEPTDPKPKASAFEVHMRVAQIEHQQFTSLVSALERSIQSVNEALADLSTAEGLETLEIALGEAGVFASKIPAANQRFLESANAAGKAAPESLPELEAHKELMSLHSADIAKALSCIDTIQSATNKFLVAKAKRKKR